MASLSVQLLTPLPRLLSDSGEVRLTSKKGVALLAYLAMHGGQAIDRGVLAALLWGDRGDQQARQNLRQTLLTLRRELGDAHAAALAIDETAIAFNVGAADVDAPHFAAMAQSTDPAKRLGCLDVAWGSFLGGFSSGAEAFDDWVITERHRLDLIATRVFSELASRLDAEGNGDRAILAIERLVQIDPSNEEGHRRLLSLEHRYRGTETALSRARSLAALLKREVDAEPEQATRDLVEAIRARNGHATHPPDLVLYGPPAISPSRDHGAQRRLWPLAIAASIAIAAAGGAAYWALPKNAVQPPVATTRVEPPQAAERSWQSPQAVSKAAANLSGQGLVAIAVRPFENHAAAGADSDLLAAMISDDLTTNLSRIPAFRVISYRTMDSYRGRRVDTATVGTELGVRYLVEGSVSSRDGTLRLNVALTDTTTQLAVWSARFERASADRQSTQDEIVAGLARELQVEVTRSESAAVQERQDIHALIFKGWASIDNLHKDGKRALDQAAGFFDRALELDPGNARALTGAAAVHAHLVVQLLVDDPAPHLSKAEKILQSVIERSADRSHAYHLLGFTHIARRDFQAAMRAFEKAIELNPSNAGAHAQLGRLLATSGRPDLGLELIAYAKRLSPRDPSLAYWYAFSGFAKLELGHFDEAIADTRFALSIMPWQPRTVLLLVSALSMAGQESEARRVLAELQEAQPHLSNAALRENYGNPKTRHLMVNQGMMRVLEARAPN